MPAPSDAPANRGMFSCGLGKEATDPFQMHGRHRWRSLDVEQADPERPLAIRPSASPCNRTDSGRNAEGGTL